MLKMKVADLSKFFAKVAENETVYLPVDTKEGASFKKYEDGMVLSEAFNTTRSAKDFFFPKTEHMVSYQVSGKEIKVTDPRKDIEDFVIFGVLCRRGILSSLDNVTVN